MTPPVQHLLFNTLQDVYTKVLDIVRVKIDADAKHGLDVEDIGETSEDS